MIPLYKWGHLRVRKGGIYYLKIESPVKGQLAHAPLDARIPSLCPSHATSKEGHFTASRESFEPKLLLASFQRPQLYSLGVPGKKSSAFIPAKALPEDGLVCVSLGLLIRLVISPKIFKPSPSQ